MCERCLNSNFKKIPSFQGSSISFSYNNTPPEQRRVGRYPSNDVFKTPSQAHHEHMQQPALGLKTPINTAFDQSRIDVSQPKTTTNDGSLNESQLHDYKKQVDCAKETVAKLEMSLKSKDAEINKMRVDLASTQSQLEQSQVELKKKTEEVVKKSNEIGKIQVDIDNHKSKVINCYLIIEQYNYSVSVSPT